MQKHKDLAPTANPNESQARQELRIEPMLLQDLDQVMRIERLSFPSPWTRSHFIEEINRNSLSHAFVLRDPISGDVAGFLLCWILSMQVHISNVAVHPSRRGRGCGEILIRHGMKLAKENGCRHVVLEVRPSNLTALRLYQRLGFRIVGELPGYYSNENAWVLSVDIAGMD